MNRIEAIKDIGIASCGFMIGRAATLTYFAVIENNASNSAFFTFIAFLWMINAYIWIKWRREK